MSGDACGFTPSFPEAYKKGKEFGTDRTGSEDVLLNVEPTARLSLIAQDLFRGQSVDFNTRSRAMKDATIGLACTDPNHYQMESSDIAVQRPRAALVDAQITGIIKLLKDQHESPTALRQVQGMYEQRIASMGGDAIDVFTKEFERRSKADGIQHVKFEAGRFQIGGN